MTPLAAINLHSCLFLLFALLACGFAVAVLTTANIVRMAFYLTISLGATAGLFFLAGAEFLGAMQLMIYVGGTLVLLIFGVMLTAQSRFISMQTPPGELIIAAIAGGSLLVILLRVAFGVGSWSTPPTLAEQSQLAAAESRTSTADGMALSGVRVDKLSQPKASLKAGMAGYHLPFVIVSMHLLVVQIGAGYMARTKKAARGGALERLAPVAEHLNRKMGFFVQVGLVKGIVVNVLLAAACFALTYYLQTHGNEDAKVKAAQTWLNSHLFLDLLWPPAPWLFPLLGSLFALNVLLIVVVYGWQQWGVVGLVAVPLIQTLMIVNGNLGTRPAILFAVLALVPVLALIGLLVNGQKPSVWSQME